MPDQSSTGEPGTGQHDRLADLAAEIRQLRARNAELAAQLDRLSAEGVGRHGAGRPGRWRAAVSAVLAALGVLLVLAAVPVVWMRDQVLDTDRYLATVAPLGRDPAVRNEIARQLAAAINERLDVEAVVREHLPPAAAPLAAPVAAGVRQFVAEVARRFTASDAFVRLWDTVNRVGHEQLVAVLTGRTGAGGTRIDGQGRVLLDLGPMIELVKQRVSDAGLSVVGRIPPTSVVVEVARISGIDRARTVVRWMDRAAAWLPWLALGCLAGAVAAARGRRRAALVLALATVGAMLLLRVALTLLRDASLDAIPADALSPAVAATVFDQLTGSLRAAGRVVAVLGLLTALAAALAGPGAAAVRLRATVLATAGALRRGGRLGTGPVGRWIGARRNLLRAAVGGAAALAALFWSTPTPATLLLIAVIAATALFAVEVLSGGRPAATGPPPARAP